MNEKRGLPIRQGILERPRIHALLAKGVEHSLLTVLAGPGYGKTQAVASYMAASKARLLWLRLTSLDNLHASFWANLTRAAEREFPQLAERMRSLQFPDTLPAQYAFFRMLTQAVYVGRQVIWVMDDFGVLSDPKVLSFFQTLLEAGLENFCLALLSNVNHSIDAVCNWSDHPFAITGMDLRFTPEETMRLYALHDIALSQDEAEQIQRFTEGWPLPLHLMLLQRTEREMMPRDATHLTQEIINRMFERRFFAGYPEDLRRLLAQLSLLSGAPKGCLYELSGSWTPQIQAILRGHVFFAYEPAGDVYVFHQLYQRFLQDKAQLLSGEERRHVYKTAADHFARSPRHTMEAITCYRKCGDYESMLRVISGFARTQMGLTMDYAGFFLEHISLLSPEQRALQPVADYLTAFIYMNTLELERAEAMSLELVRRLPEIGTSEALMLLGDVYALLGLIHMMRNQEDFGTYFQKACQYLPEGTRFRSTDKFLVQNNHNFSMQDNQPGARERMERTVHESVPWMAKALNGGMGMEHLFSAEAAYLTYQFDEARQHAYRAIYVAQEKAQHDLVLNAHIILARIGLMQGNLSEMTEQIDWVADFTSRHEFGALKEIRDTALAWYYVKLDDCEKAPRWITTLDEQQQIPITLGRERLIYANYLIQTGEFVKLVAMLENPVGLYFSRGIWPDRIYWNIMLAIGYLSLSKERDSIASLHAAYDMAFHNDLTTPFVEAGPYMRRLISAARQQGEFAFDPDWMELILARAATYSKRLLATRSAHLKKSRGGRPQASRLTKREQEILKCLSQGLTREEIAGHCSISVNTVKKALTSIYTKLGAVNRADAIFIATSEAYLQ